MKKPFKIVYDGKGWAEIVGPTGSLLMPSGGTHPTNTCVRLNAAFAAGWEDAENHYGFSHVRRRRLTKKPPKSRGEDE